MPQYKKVFDIGTYTGNGGQYRVGIPTLRGVGPTGTQVAGSTRFRSSGSAYLSRTQGSPTSNQKWTLSVWFKKSGTASTYNPIYSGSSGSAAGGDSLAIYDAGGGYIRLFLNGASSADVRTTLLIKDTSIWYNLVVAVDTTQATASNRIRMYLNGSEIKSFSTATYPSQNYNMPQINASGNVNYISRDTNTGEYFNGYFSEYYVIDGQQLTPSSFGELNSDGIWVPKAYSGTYGTNGFYLPMNSSSNYATDQSGNGNNWTPSGFNVTTANTTYDIMRDSPTDYLSGSMTTANNAGNYATLNPLEGDGGSRTLTNGNMDITLYYSSTYPRQRGTTILKSGKWYWEWTITAGGTGGTLLGVMTSPTSSSSNGLGSNSNEWGYYVGGGSVTNGANSVSVTTTATTNDVVMIALDRDTGNIWWGKNGTWFNSGNPSTGSNPIFTNVTSDVLIAVGSASGTSSSASLNSGQRAFAYTPPTGFGAVNTYNYPRPADSSLWFYGDTPDLMWIKNRSTTGLHTITDTVRGAGLNLVTSSSAAETSYPAVTEMNKFGMSVINDGTSIVNGSGNSMVYWGWKAGSNTSSTSVTNTDGTITSQVSANRQAGFSIVSFTGTGVSGTIGHGLGATPAMLIFKDRKNTGTSGWNVWHQSLSGSTYYLDLSTTAAQSSASSNFSGTWNSTVFGLTSTPLTSGAPVIAYCWTAIPGYSAFGSYTANASSDGPFIYTGFRPRWIMIKANLVQEWTMFDTTRGPYNYINATLYPNYTNAESASGNYIDIVSNGFKIRDSGGGINYSSGSTYIYAAFAEIPFKYARAR